MLIHYLVVAGFSLALIEPSVRNGELRQKKTSQAQDRESKQQRFDSIQTVILDRKSYQDTVLRAELSLRLPRVRIVPSYRKDEVLPKPYAWIRIQRDTESAQMTKLGVVMSDGRTYRREIELFGHDDERALASNIVSLLISVEQKVAIPIVGDERKELLQDFQTEGFSASQAMKVDKVNPSENEAVSSSNNGQVLHKTDPLEAPKSQGCCGVSILGVTTVGLAKPNYGGHFQGGGGELRVYHRWLRGSLAMMTLRSVFRQVGPLTISRMQISVRGGYSQQIRSLDLMIHGGLLIEPWWVRRSGNGLDQDDYVGRSPKTILYGAVVGAGLGYRIELARPGLKSLVISAVADMSASFVYDKGLKVAGIGQQESPMTIKPLARVGGLELHTGVGVTMWFDTMSNAKKTSVF